MTQKYAVIGHPIGHTMSPFIHKNLFALQGKDVDYLTLDITPDELESAMSGVLATLDGFNITIPHKEAIMPFTDVIDDSAKKYSAVNCISNRDGKTLGYSTDAFGFSKALESSGVSLSGKVLVLGSGGAARTLAREASDCGCEVTIAVRPHSIQKAEELKKWLTENKGTASICTYDEICGEYDLLINATPVGMYPNTDAMPVTEQQLMGCKAVFDAVYNPENTLLLKTAKKLGIKTVGGMAMLVWQAVKAHEHWYNAKFDQNSIEKLIADANCEMERIFGRKSIVLCGFMGCGKSTVGKLLAENLGFKLCDSDAVIEQREGTTVTEIFANKGEAYFRALESQVIHELSLKNGLIIATGGGAVMNPENAENLRKGGFVVHLDITPEAVLKRLENDTTRPLLQRNDKESAVRELLSKRNPIYSSVAHCTVDAGASPETVAKKIIELYVKNSTKS